ncbi:MAG: helix-turn-helix domain-containing protein [Spirochaetaceae bacterium]|jgi:transcriptional regulator with XRE-family HTH domain|nr:helix-turn-helix domain-containing protein [Spirochaetaceae bacterium]
MGNSFRENLRKELDYQGIIVKELSARTGIPVATLDCYLGTRATMPSADAAVKIAQALEVSVEYLVTGEEKDRRKSQKYPDRDVWEIICRLRNLSAQQCKALLGLLKAFGDNIPADAH